MDHLFPHRKHASSPTDPVAGRTGRSRAEMQEAEPRGAGVTWRGGVATSLT